MLHRLPSFGSSLLCLSLLDFLSQTPIERFQGRLFSQLLLHFGTLGCSFHSSETVLRRSEAFCFHKLVQMLIEQLFVLDKGSMLLELLPCSRLEVADILVKILCMLSEEAF